MPSRVPFRLRIARCLIGASHFADLPEDPLKLGIPRSEQVMQGVHFRSLSELGLQRGKGLLQVGTRGGQLTLSDEHVGQGKAVPAPTLVSPIMPVKL